MSSSFRLTSGQFAIKAATVGFVPDPVLTVHKLNNSQKAEVLAFCRARPLHTVFLRGFIYDNGLESDLNRGTFYGCRGGDGQLRGVALIGHATLFETCSDAVIQAFGREARQHPEINMIMGEQSAVTTFWSSLAIKDREPRRICTELLFEQQLTRSENQDGFGILRPAVMEDIDRVMPIQSQMAFNESGVHPEKTDPEGFRKRYARRIQQGRVWVCVDDQALTFKVDILSATPEVTYLEGIYVDPRYRGNGFGLNCLAQVGRNLSKYTKSLCLFVNQQCREGQEFYKRAGFRLRSTYSTFFLERTIRE